MEFLKNIKSKISDSEYNEIKEMFQNLENNSIQETQKFNKTNFIAKFKIYKKNITLKNSQKICKCNSYELCPVKKSYELTKCKNYLNFIENNPITGLMFGLNSSLSFSTNYDPSSDEKKIQYNFMNLLILSESLSGKEKLLIGTAIIYYSIKNIYNLLIDKSLALIVNKVIDKFLENIRFQLVLKEFGITNNMFFEIIKLPLYE